MNGDFSPRKDPSERFYQSGETVETPAGPVLVRGWRVQFRPSEYQKYAGKYPQRDFVYSLHFPAVSGTQSSLGMVRGGVATVGGFNEIVDKGIKYQEVRMFPPASAGAILNEINLQTVTMLSFMATEGDDIKQTAHYPIRLRSFTSKPKEEDETLVQSETDMGSEVLGKMDNIVRSFRPFFLPSVYAYFNDVPGSDRGGTRYSSGSRLVYPSEIFTQPVYEGEGTIRLVSDLASSIIGRQLIPLQGKEHPYYSTFNMFRAASGPEITLPGTTPHPLIRLFSRNQYVGRNVEAANISRRSMPDFFAAVTTTLKVNPDAFIMQYQQLDPENKKFASSIIQATIRQIESSASSKNAIDQLLPSIRNVQAALGQ